MCERRGFRESGKGRSLENQPVVEREGAGRREGRTFKWVMLSHWQWWKSRRTRSRLEPPLPRTWLVSQVSGTNEQEEEAALSGSWGLCPFWALPPGVEGLCWEMVLPSPSKRSSCSRRAAPLPGHRVLGLLGRSPGGQGLGWASSLPCQGRLTASPEDRVCQEAACAGDEVPSRRSKDGDSSVCLHSLPQQDRRNSSTYPSEICPRPQCPWAAKVTA